VSKEAVGSRQAVWNTDEQTLTYDGTTLHMEQFEFREAEQLLYRELMLGLKTLPHMHA
jgi:hypothetical protein